jgi:hypothetical protein
MTIALRQGLVASAATALAAAAVWMTAPATPENVSPASLKAWANVNCGLSSPSISPVATVQRDELLAEQAILDRTASLHGHDAMCVTSAERRRNLELAVATRDRG